MLRIALGQFNAAVGDLSGNREKMEKMYAEAASAGADLVVFPELAICGYPPGDLLSRKDFLSNCRLMIEKLAAACPDKTIIAGLAENYQGDTYNSAAILQNGAIQRIYRKCLLPNSGFFDERRYFKAGSEPVILNINGLKAAVTICRDIWDAGWLSGFLQDAGRFQILINISASPFHTDKIPGRLKVISKCANSLHCAVAYCNLVGAQDGIVCDGNSVFADSTGQITARAESFQEDLLIADVETDRTGSVQVKPLKALKPAPQNPLEQVYKALVLGTRDYILKNRFKKVLLGLSGGIDSSVTACIAAAALGAENVTAVTMPSRFNTAGTKDDAEKVAENLGVDFLTVPIEPVLERFDKSLGQVDGWDSKGIAYENLQARIRGTVLMSLSNRFGALVLTSGNKSELAVGYVTLYGDMAGGFSVLKDVYKTMVYELADYINEINSREIIPASVINRAPSAELSPGQKDSDTLPDYRIHDRILAGYTEQGKSADQLIEEGLPAEIVSHVAEMIDRNEYKRRQAPPGVKITPRSFGGDGRLPITNLYNPSDYSR